MKEQVLSAEQMQELIDMGIDVSKASMYWYDSCGEYICSPNYNDITSDCIPAFTLQDILTLLPYRISTTYPSYLSIHPLHDGGWYIRYSRMECDEKSTGGKTLLEAAFHMLKWCKINNYL